VSAPRDWVDRISEYRTGKRILRNFKPQDVKRVALTLRALLDVLDVAEITDRSESAKARAAVRAFAVGVHACFGCGALGAVWDAMPGFSSREAAFCGFAFQDVGDWWR
jgi:hypothetical protein